MSELIRVEIVTPERAVYAADAKSVTVPGADGELCVLAGHRPLFTTIRVGPMVVEGVVDGVDEKRIFIIEGGFAEVLPNKVIILTNHCEGSEESDITIAQEMVKKAEHALKKLHGEDEVHHEVRDEYYDALDRARRRLAFSEEHK